jgi:hypothetical protein
MNMYNMEITIGSYKCRLEICILIVIVFWVMFGHVMCSCCTISMQEGLDIMKRAREGFVAPVARRRADNLYNQDEGFVAPVARRRVNGEEVEETETTEKEGFVSSNNKAYGPEFGSNKSPGYIMRPDTWAQPTLSYSMGTTPSAGAQAILNRPKQPIPLPEGELDVFATTQFKPECCPNAFSTSSGCACMTTEQLGYLHARGGNNVPYSEY